MRRLRLPSSPLTARPINPSEPRIPADIHSVEGKETFVLNRETLALIRTGAVLGLPGSEAGGGSYLTVLVLRSGALRMGFAVNEVLQEQEVVFKSLGKYLGRVPNVAGATVLGSGRVVPILDVPDLMRSASSVAAVRAETATAAERKRARSVLVVEDSITSRMLMKDILESAGFSVSTAVDGVDASGQLDRSSFDLVVSDIEMPRMNGFELTSKIRGGGKHSELPIILVTGLESQSDRERGLAAGASAYILKSSFDESNLIEAIQRLI